MGDSETPVMEADLRGLRCPLPVLKTRHRMKGLALGERIAVLSDTGERSDVTLDTITIDGASPPRPGQRFYYETTLNLRKRPHRIVVAVSDPISGEILSSHGDIDA